MSVLKARLLLLIFIFFYLILLFWVIYIYIYLLYYSLPNPYTRSEYMCACVVRWLNDNNERIIGLKNGYIIYYIHTHTCASSRGPTLTLSYGEAAVIVNNKPQTAAMVVNWWKTCTRPERKWVYILINSEMSSPR